MADEDAEQSDYLSRKAKRERIVSLMRDGDWRAVLAEYDGRYHEPLLVWVRPSMDMLRFIEEQARYER